MRFGLRFVFLLLLLSCFGFVPLKKRFSNRPIAKEAEKSGKSVDVEEKADSESEEKNPGPAASRPKKIAKNNKGRRKINNAGKKVVFSVQKNRKSDRKSISTSSRKMARRGGNRQKIGEGMTAYSGRKSANRSVSKPIVNNKRERGGGSKIASIGTSGFKLSSVKSKKAARRGGNRQKIGDTAAVSSGRRSVNRSEPKPLLRKSSFANKKERSGGFKSVFLSEGLARGGVKPLPGGKKQSFADRRRQLSAKSKKEAKRGGNRLKIGETVVASSGRRSVNRSESNFSLVNRSAKQKRFSPIIEESQKSVQKPAVTRIRQAAKRGGERQEIGDKVATASGKRSLSRIKSRDSGKEKILASLWPKLSENLIADTKDMRMRKSTKLPVSEAKDRRKKTANKIMEFFSTENTRLGKTKKETSGAGEKTATSVEPMRKYHLAEKKVDRECFTEDLDESSFEFLPDEAVVGKTSEAGKVCRKPMKQMVGRKAKSPKVVQPINYQPISRVIVTLSEKFALDRQLELLDSVIFFGDGGRRIRLDYSTMDTLHMWQARKILVDTVEDLLKELNEDEEVAAVLGNSPLTPSDLELVIHMGSYYTTVLDLNSLGLITLKNGIAHYIASNAFNDDSTDCWDKRSETYEQSKNFVLAKRDGEKLYRQEKKERVSSFGSERYKPSAKDKRIVY